MTTQISPQTSVEPILWHTLDTNQLADELHVNIQTGLADADVQTRHKIQHPHQRKWLADTR